jgi:capsid protein
VQLDVRSIEVDQVATPWPVPRGDLKAVDGIVFDEFGNPIAYYVLRQHPGDNTAFRSGGIEFDVMPFESVIHLFRAERPGQSRGIPEVTSSLSLFATLRRYTLAVLGAAEQAALPSGVIYTDAAADAESSQVEPMDTVEMDRGTWMTMPFGWKISQVKAEQPTTEDYLRPLERHRSNSHCERKIESTSLVHPDVTRASTFNCSLQAMLFVGLG